MVLSQFLEMGSSRLSLVVEDKMTLFFCLVGGHKNLNQTMTYEVHLSVSVFFFHLHSSFSYARITHVGVAPPCSNKTLMSLYYRWFWRWNRSCRHVLSLYVCSLRNVVPCQRRQRCVDCPVAVAVDDDVNGLVLVKMLTEWHRLSQACRCGLPSPFLISEITMLLAVPSLHIHDVSTSSNFEHLIWSPHCRMRRPAWSVSAHRLCLCPYKSCHRLGKILPQVTMVLRILSCWGVKTRDGNDWEWCGKLSNR
jgi:hypothetical protein